MIVLTIASHKGGVGKTTLALNISFALARRGWRTLLVDADAQGAIGHSLGPAVTRSSGLADYLAGRAGLPDATIHTRLAELDILPAGAHEGGPKDQFGARLADGATLRRLEREASGRYDLMIIDAPGGTGDATVGCLRVATHVLSPLQAEPLAVRSLSNLLDLIGALRDEGERLELTGVVLNMVGDDPVSTEVARSVRERLPTELVLEPSIPRSFTVLDASAKGVPLGLLRRRQPPEAELFDRLASRLESRIGLTYDGDDEPLPLLL